MSFLKVDNLNKSYGKHEVLKDVSFDLDQPGIVALVGPNGSGKSTLLNVIANIISKNSGDIEILGKSYKDISVYMDYSYMIDNTVLYRDLTGLDHLKYVVETHKMPKSVLREAMDILNIGSFANKKTKDYSLGMKQQLLFTMAIVTKPKLLVLDEPFNGLDPSTVIKVRKILIDYASKGNLVLLSSHNLAEVDQMTSHILFVKDKGILEEDIKKYQRNKYFIKTLNPQKTFEKLASDSGVFNYENDLITLLNPLNSDINPYLKKIMEIDEIFDIRKELVGSEERYKELYNIS